MQSTTAITRLTTQCISFSRRKSGLGHWSWPTRAGQRRCGSGFTNSAGRLRAAMTTREGMMAKGYWVSTYRAVHDQDKMAAYAKLAGPSVEANGGKFIVRGVAAKAYEQGVVGRTVIVEFDSVEAAGAPRRARAATTRPHSMRWPTASTATSASSRASEPAPLYRQRDLSALDLRGRSIRWRSRG